MVRKKKSKALFEILSQGRGAVEIPDWIKNQGQEQAETQPGSEQPVDDLAADKQETPAELVEEQQPTAEKIENIEPEVQEVQQEEPPEIELQDVDEVEVEDDQPQDETPELEDELEQTAPDDECSAETEVEYIEEDQPAAEMTQPELFTTEQDATNEADEDAIIEDAVEVDAVEEQTEVAGDEVVAEDIESVDDEFLPDGSEGAVRRIKHKLPYDVPKDVPDSGVYLAPEPFMKVEQDRIRISMTRVGAMIVLGAVLVFLVAAFAVGVAIGRPGVSETAAQPQNLPPMSENLRVNGERAPVDNDKAILVEPANRTSGRHYFVLERIASNGDVDLDDADNLMKFLSDRGYPSQLVNLAPKGRPQQLALWGLHGFENKNSRAAEQYKQGLKKAGEEYFRAYGKYKCDNPSPLEKK
ncbi:MAG: hypothetical protein KAR11_02155 [Phycisphaerae bacterium]|nr:hypothetical protein [Phycisphaerae bacterium]